MTYDETTLFRNFMKGKGMLNNFEFLYNQYKLSDIDIIDYYDETHAEMVITTAFDFSKSRIFSYQYWQNLEEKWREVLENFRKNGERLEKPTVRCAKCGKMKPESEFRFRKNGLLHKFCIECEGGKPLVVKDTKVCSRCGKEKPREEFYDSPSTRDGKSSYCKECIKDLSKESYNKSKEKQIEQPKENNMEDFTFYDFDKPQQFRRIVQGTAVINSKKSGKYLIFGIDDSADIIRSKLLKMRVRVDNITGVLHFVFNKEQGAAVVVKDNNAKLCNAELVDFLVDYLHLSKKEERHVINIGENLSRTNEYITYKVSTN